MAGDTYLTVVGNLTADPVLRATSNGGAVVNLTIASTPRQYDRSTIQWVDGEALFMRCSAWDSTYSPMASNIQASLAKGMRVIARGRLVQRSYQDREGNNRTAIELHLDEIGPALTRNTAQVSKNPNASNNSSSNGNGNGGRQSQGTSLPPRDPWAGPEDDRGGAGDDEPEF